ncbi:hypothetical protein PENSPDRAFT_660150, partial [Peniophora sp. CONT]
MAPSSAGPSEPMATDGDEDPPKQSLDEDHDQEQVPLAVAATASQLTCPSFQGSGWLFSFIGRLSSHDGMVA